MQPIGLELIIDVSQCYSANIHDVKQLQVIMHHIAKIMDTTIVGEIHHEFTPYGITILAIVADSHIAIHTWPEYHHIAIDIFSCKMNIPDTLLSYIEEVLESKEITYHKMERNTKLF
jgi:S-adenosylmethionine decarboxylase proenzyme